MMNHPFHEILDNILTEKPVDRILVLGHINPDGDCVGSLLGTAHYLRTLYPELEICPYLAKVTEKGPNLLLAKERLFDYYTLPSSEGEYGIVTVDCATKKRLHGREFLDKAAWTFAVDHHATHENYETEHFIRSDESCAELLVSILKEEVLIENFKKTKEKSPQNPAAADYYYLGMLHDTDRFLRCGSDTLQIGQKLLSIGVNHKELVKTLQTATLADYKKESQLIASSLLTCHDKVAYLVYDRNRIEKDGITYDDIHPISGKLRDFYGICVGFTMYEEEKDKWRCSFRSDGICLNVDKLVNNYGGGGHAGAAGLTYETHDGDALLKSLLADIESILELEKEDNL